MPLTDSLNLLRLGLGLLLRPTIQVLNQARLEMTATEALEAARAHDFQALSHAKFSVPADQLEARAFWLNLYNALTLHAIHAAQIRDSMLESLGFYAKFAYVVAGQPTTLSEIEHGVLRANQAVLLGNKPLPPTDPRAAWVLPLDARIHFALNCGAVSCPPIRAYQAAQLEAQLEFATQSYLQECRIENGILLVPRLFSYYPKDFGDVSGFIRRYRPDLTAFSKIRYLPYSWLLTK